MIYLNGTTNIYGQIDFGSGSLWEAPAPPTGSTLLIGLEHYWKYDETSGTTASDAVGGVTGDVTEGSFVSGGKINYAWQGTGTSMSQGVNVITTVLNPNYNSVFSVNVWVQHTGNQTMLVGSNNPPGATGGWYIAKNTSGKLYTEIRQVNNAGLINKTAISSTGIANNVWYMITLTYDGSTNSSGWKLYQNGSLIPMTVGTDTLGNSATNNNSKFSLGGYQNPANTYSWRGKQDEWAAWSKELTTEEITELYNSGAGIQYPF